jgi:choline dehydrogenase
MSWDFSDFNYFPPAEAQTSERDLSAVAEGVDFARRIMDVLQIVTGPLEEKSPGRDVASIEQVK